MLVRYILWFICKKKTIIPTNFLPIGPILTRFQQLFIQLQDHGFISAERAREATEGMEFPESSPTFP